MKKIYQVITLLFVFLSSNSLTAQALTGTFTIGPNGADYATFAAAISELQTEGVGQGGVNFSIQPGVYSENFVLENISGLAENNRLTFMATPGSVTIEAIGTSANNDAIIRVNSLSYITFDGLTLVDVSTTTAVIEYGIYFQGSATVGCSHNIIKNTAITLGANGARPIVATRGIFFSSLAQSVAASNSNNIIDNISVDNASWGIQFRCAANLFGQITQADFNNQVINSTFGANLSLGHDLSSGALAINALGGRNMVINNNVIQSIQNFNSAPALPVSTAGISLDSCSGIVSGNFINNIEYEGSNGLVFGIRSSTFLGETTLITNNKISGLKRSNFVASTTDPSFTITGIWIFSQSGNNGLARVLHNSVYLDSVNPVTYSTAGVNLSGGSTGQFPAEVFNNIIVNRISASTTPYKSYALVDGNTTRGFLISNNNNLFADGTNGYLGGIGRELGGTEQFSNNLADFIIFSETNSNSVNFLPVFTNAASGDLSFNENLVTSDAYLGPNLAAVPVDILSNLRTTPETFLGAYEGPEFLSISSFSASTLMLYPNPSCEVINIRSNYFTGNPISYEIYDQLGQRVLSSQNSLPINEEISISIASLSPGMYFIRILNDRASTGTKFLVN